MKVKKVLLTAMAVVAMVGVASAQILIPNGDFEAGNTGWVEASGGGVVFSYPASGGNGGGYASMDATSGDWGVLVSPPEAGAIDGGHDIGIIGVTAGATETFTIDLITLVGTAAGGLKVEAWGGSTLLGHSGDVLAAGPSATWQTLTFDWAVPAGTEKMIFVPLWGANSTIGYDNVGVVPEPATLGLLGIGAATMLLIRRRRI